MAGAYKIHHSGIKSWKKEEPIIVPDARHQDIECLVKRPTCLQFDRNSRRTSKRYSPVSPLSLGTAASSPERDNRLPFSPIPTSSENAASSCSSSRKMDWRKSADVLALPLSPAFVMTSTPAPDNMPSTSSASNTQDDSRVFQFSDEAMCRICHEGEAEEVLVSPCHCAGTMGLLHMSCLEKWLGSCKQTMCEICHFQFVIKKKPRSLKWCFQEPSLRMEKRVLIRDIVVSIGVGIFCLFFVILCSIIAKKLPNESDYTYAKAVLIILSSFILPVLCGIWLRFAVARIHKLISSWRKNYYVIQISQTKGENGNTTSRTVFRRKSDEPTLLKYDRANVHLSLDQSLDSYKIAMMNSVLPNLPDHNNNSVSVSSLEGSNKEVSILYYEPMTFGDSATFVDPKGCLLREASV